MGATGSRAAHSVEVRLRPPVNLDPGMGLRFVARLHSAADGVTKYRDWGESQTLGLWADDIVTISLYAAQTEEHFDAYQYDEVAELYVPWDEIRRSTRNAQPGEEVFFDLGLSRADSWLGHNATLKQYREAFAAAQEAAQRDPMGRPRICIGVREVNVHDISYENHPWEAGSPDPPGVDSPPPHELRDQEMHRFHPQGQVQRWPEMPMPTRRIGEGLDHDEGYRLYQLQMRNQELRKQCTALGLREVDVPDVQDQVRAHADLFDRSAAENAHLRQETYLVERELAKAYGEGSAECFGGQDVQEEVAQRCAAIMQEIRKMIQDNVELSSQCDGDIRRLEEDLILTKQHQSQDGQGKMPLDGDNQVVLLRQQLDQQQDEHQAIMEECSRLDNFLEVAAVEAQSNRSEAQALQARRVDELEAEGRALQQEITDLQQQLRDRPSLVGSDVMSNMPATCVLSEEVEHLQLKLAESQRRRAQEQVEMEQRPGQLRRETRAMREKLQETLEARVRANRDLEELQQSHERELEELRSTAVERAAATRAREEKELLRESLSKDVARSKRRIEFFDQKVDQLRLESQDLRQRAELARQSVPVIPGAEASREVLNMQDTLHEGQLHVQTTRQEQQALQKERDRARQDLENSLVEARVAEQKLRLLRDRTSHYSAEDLRQG